MIEYKLKLANNLEDAFKNLYEIITLLRSENGCPWDREQTPKSACTSLIDEAYEYIESCIKDDIDNSKEEIGDILLNAFLCLRIHEENNNFKPEEAINAVCEKLIRRHTHVFGSDTALNAEEGIALWNKAKEKENKKFKSLIDKIPANLPPLEKAYELQKKSSKFVFNYIELDEVFNKIYENLDTIKAEIIDENNTAIENSIGHLLFEISNLARLYGIRSNIALHTMNNSFISKFYAFEKIIKEKNISYDNKEDLIRIWKTIK